LRWLRLVAAFEGLGLNIKMMQVFLVLPAFYLLYLLTAHDVLSS
jgi:4-amino-4-deoxy-L-arabinose transferase-like glycosyltransferase